MLSSASSFGSPSNREGGSFKPMIGIILLRLGAGLTLLYLHGWNLGFTVWQHLWNQMPWEAVTTVEKAGLPFPKALAVTGAIIAVFTAVSWILGFVTRLSSAIFLPVTLTTLWVANRAGENLAAEMCILYFFIALTLLLNGSGWLALDTLFKRKKAKSRW